MGRDPHAIRATIHDTFRFLILINPDSDSTLAESRPLGFRFRWPGYEIDALVPDGKVECSWNKAEVVRVKGLLV
jgi:hypothetical protein